MDEQARKERKNAYMRAWYLKNREKNLAYKKKAYLEKNREKIKAYLCCLWHHHAQLRIVRGKKSQTFERTEGFQDQLNCSCDEYRQNPIHACCCYCTIRMGFKLVTRSCRFIRFPRSQEPSEALSMRHKKQ